MKWTVFMPVLNEGQIIESKLKHSLKIGRTVVVEGSVPEAVNAGSNGLSSDETTEILEQYSDSIVHIKAGKCKNKIDLQNHALNYIHKNFPDTEILHRTDADEFIDLNYIISIENVMRRNPCWMIYTDLYNLIDATRGRDNIAPQSQQFPFCPGLTLRSGMYHERFYRYRYDLGYRGTAHALSDGMGRMLYSHPDYYFNRTYKEGNPIFHYKYVDGIKRLVATEMNYLVRDEKMIPYQQKTFDAAIVRLKNILEGETFPLKRENHCKDVLESKWFKYEPIDNKLDDITLDEVLAIL